MHFLSARRRFATSIFGLVLTVAALPQCARAEIPHASTQVGGGTDGFEPTGDQDEGRLGAFSSIFVRHHGGDDTFYFDTGNEGSALVAYNPDTGIRGLIHTYADAFDDLTHGLSGPRVTTGAAANFVDSYTLGNVGGVNPFTLRFTFGMEGSFKSIAGGSQFNIQMDTSLDAFNLGVTPASARSVIVRGSQYGGPEDGFVSSGWSRLRIEPDLVDPTHIRFRGEYDLDLVVPPTNGLVEGAWSLGNLLIADISPERGLFNSTTLDSRSTGGLLGVYVVGSDGVARTPESIGMTLAFGAGFASPNFVVPEPSSVVLLASGAVGLVAWQRRRRVAG